MKWFAVSLTIIIMLFSANKHHLKIHQTLNRNGFYRLPLHKLLEIIHLLGMPASREAKFIQEYAIKGLEKVLERQKKSSEGGIRREKRYFNEGTGQAVSIEVKNYVTFIVDELLQSEQKQLEDCFQMPSPFPFMSLNYPKFQPQIAPQHPQKQLSQQMQQRMKSQIQMYYMNMFNYNSPHNQFYNQEVKAQEMSQKKIQIEQEQMNRNEHESQNAAPLDVPEILEEFKSVESEQQKEDKCLSVDRDIEDRGQSSIHEKIKNLVENEQIIGNIEVQQQPILEIRNEQKMIDEKEDPSNVVSIVDVPKQPSIEEVHEIKLMKQNSISHHQLTLKSINSNHKSHNNQPESPSHQPVVSIHNIIIKDIPKRKAQQTQIQIQTDLTLLNQQIEVTPRNRFLKKKIRKQKKKQEHQRLVYHDEPTKRTFIGKYPVQQQFIPSEKGKKKDYVLTISKSDLLVNQPAFVNEVPSQLPRLQSEIQLFKAKINEELKQISNALSSAQQFSNCFCKGGLKDVQHSFQCYLCNKNYHCSCVSISNEQKKQACPFCRLLNVDPIHEVKQTIKTMLIENISKQQVLFQVNLSHYEYYLIRRMRSHDIELRCLKIGTSFQYSEITWPDEAQLYVNDRKIVEFPALHYQSSMRKRKDYPIAITHFIFGEANQSEEGYRHVQIRLKMKDIKSSQYKYKHINNDFQFLLGVYFIEKIKQEELTKMYHSSLRQYSYDFLQDLLKVEGEIQIQKIVCTLFDPFSKKMIDTPVRGINCNHGQCFDLDTYINFMYNMQNRNWRCPICSKQTKQFYIDNQFVELITKSKREKIIPSQITFTKEGNVLLKVIDEEEEQKNNFKSLIKAKKDKKKKRQTFPQQHKYTVKQQQVGPQRYQKVYETEAKELKINAQPDDSN